MARGERDARGERGWTVLETILAVLVVGLLGAIAVPNLLAARVRNGEAAAARTVRAIVAAEALVRASGRIDEDRDGRGEHAFLLELSGDRGPPRTDGAPLCASGRKLLPELYLKVRAEGEAVLTGYCYRLWLPGEGGRGVGERYVGGALEPKSRVDPGLAASAWCVYAWPESRGSTGQRTFFANQLGVPSAADAPYGGLPAPGAPADAPRGPRPGAAFLGPGPLDTLTGAPALGTTGRDGACWRAVR